MPANSHTHGYHREPQLSASQVSEYVYVNSTNRRRILKAAKFPPIGPMIQYDSARNALRNYLLATAANRDLSSSMNELSLRLENDDLSDFEQKRAQLNWEALNAFHISESKELRSIQFSRPGKRLQTLNLSDVAISVNVDVRTKKIDRNGVLKTGGLIFYFSKARKANADDHCKGLSLLAFECLKEDDFSESLDPTMCMALDVFRGELHRARSEQRNLFRTVKNSCEEVRDRWPSIEPPPDYHGPIID